MKSLKLSIDQTSYRINDNLEFYLEINNSSFDIEDLSNININIYRYGEKRIEFSLGFGTAPKLIDNKFIISKQIPQTLEEGIYFIRHIKFIFGDFEKGTHRELSFLPKRDFELVFFQIGLEDGLAISRLEIFSRVLVLSQKQHDYKNKPILTSSAQKNKTNLEYNVLVFGVGNLIHNIHELNGYTIYPIKDGLNYSNMNNPVNEFLEKHLKVSIPFNESIDLKFRKSTPLFVIDYLTINAVNPKDAIDHSINLSQNIYSILGYKNGQRPEIFAYVCRDKSNNQLTYDFQFPGYAGELVNSFDPSAITKEIDNLNPLLENDPWLRFVIDNYSFAINDRNKDLRYFRLWAILELISKKEITENDIELLSPDGTPIILQNGQPRKTSNTLGKVYQCIYNANLQHVTYTSQIADISFNILFEMSEFHASNENIEKISLWEAVSAMYAIRNSVAHKGQFILSEAENGDWKDKLAVKYYSLGFNIFLSHMESVVKKIIDIQIEKQKTLHNMRYM